MFFAYKLMRLKAGLYGIPSAYHVTDKIDAKCFCHISTKLGIFIHSNFSESMKLYFRMALHWIQLVATWENVNNSSIVFQSYICRHLFDSALRTVDVPTAAKTWEFSHLQASVNVTDAVKCVEANISKYYTMNRYVILCSNIVKSGCWTINTCIIAHLLERGLFVCF